MSVNYFTNGLRLKVGASSQIAMLIVIPHLLSLSLIVFSDDIPLSIKIGLFFLLLVSFMYFFRLYYFKSAKKAVKSLAQDSIGNWSIETVEKAHQAVTLSSTSFISRYLSILNFENAEKQLFTVLISPDVLAKEEYRRLRVRLNVHNSG